MGDATDAPYERTDAPAFRIATRGSLPPGSSVPSSSSMPWSEHGAVALTALRAQRINSHWHQFWSSLVSVS